MKCSILHESAGRLRVRLHCPAMTLRQADVLEYYLRAVDGVTEVKVYDRTRDAVVCFACGRGDVIASLAAFSFPRAAAMELVPRLTVRDDDALLVAEAEYRVGQVFGKSATGLWPCGEYAEQYGWGSVEIRIAFYRDFADMQVVTVMAQVGGSRKKIVHKQLVSCVQ